MFELRTTLPLDLIRSNDDKCLTVDDDDTLVDDDDTLVDDDDTLVDDEDTLVDDEDTLVDDEDTLVDDDDTLVDDDDTLVDAAFAPNLIKGERYLSSTKGICSGLCTRMPPLITVFIHSIITLNECPFSNPLGAAGRGNPLLKLLELLIP